MDLIVNAANSMHDALSVPHIRGATDISYTTFKSELHQYGICKA